MPRRARTVVRRRPRQKRGEDTVTLLVDVTARVVSEVGFHAATTNKIAKLAGVSIGTLYHYFPTKEALVTAVVHRMWQGELLAVMKHAHAFEHAPLATAIRGAVKALAEEVARQLPLYRSWYVDAPHLGELKQGLTMTNAATEFVRDALEKRRDEVRPRDLAFAADLTVKTALAMIRTGARDWEARLLDGQLAEEVGDMLVGYLLG